MKPGNIDAIVIGGSAGALDALAAILPALPADFCIPIAIVVHVLPSKPSLLSQVLGARSNLCVKEAEDKEPVAPNGIYVAPPNYHLLIERHRSFALSCDAHVNFSRPSIDVLFDTASEAFGASLLAVLLSGANEDGVAGLRTITANGGIAAVQSPESAAVPTMPAAAIRSAQPTHVLPLAEIGPFLVRIGATAHLPPPPSLISSAK
jgi:two-component system, chemotaxis family, protein-glutamate methylesterase/glutaminase